MLDILNIFLKNMVDMGVHRSLSLSSYFSFVFLSYCLSESHYKQKILNLPWVNLEQGKLQPFLCLYIPIRTLDANFIRHKLQCEVVNIRIYI